ncbi:MAG: adenylate cyclase [Frankiaceae bacterium]|jgi:adenylate cyclase|nr:adenylate cyclase [Frankiaceae bacterium]
MGDDSVSESRGPLDRLESELLGGSRRYTRAEVAERAGVDFEHGRTLWRALGFADVDDDNVAFTDRDVEALRTVQSLVDIGILDRGQQLAVTRAMGQALSRLAEWQVATLTEAMGRGSARVDPDDATVAARELVPVMEGLIGYVWRRHLAATAARVFAAGPGDAVARPMSVGFADLVGFTSLTRHVDEAALAALVDRFEEISYDVISGLGGRVVKTVGDEVMFTADDARVGVEIALALADRVGAEADLPDLRVGVACGTVVSRLGDVYGEPVNIASRLTSFARPGSVLVDRELATALEGDDRWQVRRVPPRPVRGYTLLQGFRLRRAGDTDD